MRGMGAFYCWITLSRWACGVHVSYSIKNISILFLLSTVCTYLISITIKWNNGCLLNYCINIYYCVFGNVCIVQLKMNGTNLCPYLLFFLVLSIYPSSSVFLPFLLTPHFTVHFFLFHFHLNACLFASSLFCSVPFLLSWLFSSLLDILLSCFLPIPSFVTLSFPLLCSLSKLFFPPFLTFGPLLLLELGDGGGGGEVFCCPIFSLSDQPEIISALLKCCLSPAK